MWWWALIPVVSMITGPAVLYILKRRKQTDDDTDERYDELSRKYDELLEKTESGEPPATGERHPQA
ncbi:hypothetical protein ABZW47_06215 [Streptomyces sp. NPDC004549]|uniref:hypothetical protein n=1 Tax=Streptomyces sp. NPDC004549 TaxID=3154283 RepID=UPI0033BC8384